MIIYTVQQGDTLYGIGRQYGVDPQIIARDNALTTPGALTVGQTLVILQPRTVYTAREGDTLYSVAQRFGVTVGELWRNNPFLGGRTALQAGQVLTIVPEEKATDRDFSTNAYVYDSVNRDLLRKMLPFLTYLTIFAYQVEEDGELIEPDDEELIELARQYGTAPMMLVASLNERGVFSSELAERILTDENVQSTLIEEIATTLSQKRYAGVEIDFEYVPGELAEEYVAFVRRLRERISPAGYLTFVSLAPKTSSGQPGLLYEGHDYRGMGEAADKTFLMTYEWGYAFGPPMAVSPLNKVEEVVDYAVSQIPPEKIILGVPNYGYDWTLPFERGSRARSLGNEEAVRLAAEKKASIEYDEEAQAPYFRYFDRAGGTPVEHIVWFEDARSIQAMLQLMNRFGLDGVGIWNGMRDFSQLWQVINQAGRIRKIWG